MELYMDSHMGPHIDSYMGPHMDSHMDSYMGPHIDSHMSFHIDSHMDPHMEFHKRKMKIGNSHAKICNCGSCNNYAGRGLLPTHELEFLITNLLV